MNKDKNISFFKYIDNNLNNFNNDYYNINSNTFPIVGHYRKKKNNSVENNIRSKNINFFINTTNNIKDNIDTSYEQTYNNKQENNIYVHKRFTTLDISKSLSSFESNTSSFVSSNSSKNNVFLNDSPLINKQMAKNKTNFNNKSKKIKIFIGLELGNTECKIGLFNKNSDKNENLTCVKIPTIISFFPNTDNPNKINIKIGDEAENYRIDNYDQTIFNLIKLFGQNNTEISGKKELWPFNIYNDSNINRPMIKIKYLNNDIYYNIEDILIIYLRKAFELFFDKLKFGQNKDKVYLVINIAIAIPNYFNYLQRNILLKIYNKNLFHKKNYNKYSKYNIELKNIYIESISNLISYSLFENFFQQKIEVYYLILSIGGCSTNISLVKLNKEHKNNYIEIKYINSAEFGEEDFLDNLINSCLEKFNEKIKNNCLNSPEILARIRKALNESKKQFDKEEITQTQININRLFGNIDLKISLNLDNYYTACIGLFRKIIFLIKETIMNSGFDIEKINDIILIGNMAHNSKLKKMMSELFKDKNEHIYNKLIKKSENIDNDYIIKGAILHCQNKNAYFPKFKIINISPSSIGIENYNEHMEFLIKKGDYIPIKIIKSVKIKKPLNNIISINIYEGESKYVKNNKLISKNSLDINKNLLNFKKEEKYIELLFQIFMDSNYHLNVFILDKNTYKMQFECLI